VTPQGRLSDVADPRRSGSINRGTHSLLSTSRSQPVSRSAAASTPARAPVQAVPPPQPQNDLFSLDFHSPSTMNGQPSQHEVPKKDVKSDILSLFNNAPATAPQMAPAPMAQNPAMFSSLATQSGWGVQGVKPMSNAFPQGGDTWGSFTSAPPPQVSLHDTLVGEATH
jgi:stromal membrane-associated protein